MSEQQQDETAAGRDVPLMVIDGNATAEEVAALVAVLQGMAAAAGSVEPERPPRSLWADPARQVRRTPGTAPGAGVWPGRGAWLASALPG